MTYTCVVSAEPVYDEFGEESPWRINFKTNKFIIAPDCEGRDRVTALSKMCIKAHNRVAGVEDSDVDESRYSAMVERMIYDMGLEDQRKDRFALTPRKFWYTAAVVAIAVAGLANVFLPRTAPPFDPAQPYTSTHPPSLGIDFEPVKVVRDLATDMRRIDVFLGNDIAMVVAHNTRPWFIVADLKKQIRLIDDLGYSHLLDTLVSPPRWISVAPDGSAVVVCDWSGTISLIPLDLDRHVVKYTPDVLPARAFLIEENVIAWTDQESRVCSANFDDPSPEIKTGYNDIVGATSIMGVVAYSRLSSEGSVAEITLGEDLPTITRRLMAGQAISSIDASFARDVVVLALTDGTVAVFRINGDDYTSTEINLGPLKDAIEVYVSPDGAVAWLCCGNVMRLSLNSRIVDASISLEGKAVITHAWQKNSGRILIASDREGVIWAP